MYINNQKMSNIYTVVYLTPLKIFQKLRKFKYNPNKIGKQSRSETAILIRNQQHNDVKGRGVGLHGDNPLDGLRTWNNYYCLMIGNKLTITQKVIIWKQMQ